MSIYDYIAANVPGHAFYVNRHHRGTSFSETMDHRPKIIEGSSALSGDDDYDAVAFLCHYSPNSLLSNVASGMVFISWIGCRAERHVIFMKYDFFFIFLVHYRYHKFPL